MILFSFLLAISSSHCPLIEKEVYITFPRPYVEMDEQDDRVTLKEERGAMSAYHSLHFSSVTVLQWENLQENVPFKLALLPFHDDSSSLWQLLKVFKSLFWGTPCLTDEELEKESEEFNKYLGQTPIASSVGSGTDVFCKKNVVERQTLWEGKTIRLLYPTSVLPEETVAPHFLIVTKACRPDFNSLTDEEALEVEALSRRLFEIFKLEGFYSGVKLQKNGTVGVTVPHFHQHLIFFLQKDGEQPALYKMIKNIFFGSSSLSDKQYQGNYDFYKKWLVPQL